MQLAPDNFCCNCHHYAIGEEWQVGLSREPVPIHEECFPGVLCEDKPQGLAKLSIERAEID